MDLCQRRDARYTMNENKTVQNAIDELYQAFRELYDSIENELEGLLKFMLSMSTKVINLITRLVTLARGSND